MVRLLLSFMLVALELAGAAQWACAAEPPSVRLRVEPDPPSADQSFNLIFEARGDVDADPDFKPLDADFEILGHNQQTSLEIVNGRRSRSTIWQLNVLPKHGAPLTVPAIRFGKLATDARTIEFGAAGTASADDDGLFLEVDAEPANPYVQQQVIYRLRLWRRFEISNASLSEPTVTADAIIKPIDADRRYEDTRDGKRYEVIERRFAIFPQASGKVTIKPAVVTAQVVKRGVPLFESFSAPVTTKRVVSKAVELNVRPIPSSFPGQTWLPARQLSLNEQWQPAGGHATVGEPVTRTLNLWADGLTAGQLPLLDTADVDGLKQYPDRPQTSEQQQASGYSAVLQRKTAIIPTRPGTLALPAIEIPWWNTQTDTLEFARVPAAQLVSVGAPAGVPPPPPAAAAAQAQTPAKPLAPTTPAANAAVAARAPDGYWRTLALVAVCGWLLTLVLWWRRPAPPIDGVPVSASLASLGAREREVDARIAAGDAPAIAAALLHWAAARWPDSPPRSLGALAARVAPEFAAALWTLDGALYRAQAPAADLARLRDAWRAARHAASETPPQTTDTLPPLYATAR